MNVWNVMKDVELTERTRRRQGRKGYIYFLVPEWPSQNWHRR
jgi:hypothetical protein